MAELLQAFDDIAISGAVLKLKFARIKAAQAAAAGLIIDVSERRFERRYTLLGRVVDNVFERQRSSSGTSR